MIRLPLHRDLAVRLDRELHAATDTLSALQVLAQLGREHTPDADGYGHGGEQGGGGRSSDTTSSTERAALAPIDPGTRALADAIEHFFAASKHLAAANAKLAEFHRPRSLPGAGRPVTVVACQACGELALPRVIAGYCPACYQRWYRLGRPERSTFERDTQRRAQ